jgi:hypothetical protein
MKENIKTKICKWLWIIVLALVGIGFLMLFLVGAFADVPSFRVLENPKTTWLPNSFQKTV